MVKYKWNFSKKEIEEIVRLYTEEMNSVSHIAKLYNIGNWVIQRVLKNEKIDIRDNNMYKSKAVDSKFFEVIDSEEKAYWLGFIYADGYVTQHKSSLTFGVSLSYTDLNHLIKLKQTLKSDHKIITGLGNTNYGPSHFCKLCITNKCLVKNLISKGVVFNKSKILKPPTPDQIPNHLIHHFIRGYFDGDGSVYSSKHNEGTISMVGTEDLLNWILNHVKTSVTTKAQVLKYKNKDVWEFKIGGTNNFINVYKYLYKDATVYLDRKFNKFHDIFSIRKIDVQRL